MAEILALGLDTRPAEEGARRYSRSLDEVAKANTRADGSVASLEDRFRGLARTAGSGVVSFARWTLQSSVLLYSVGLLTRGLSALSTGAMAVFLGTTSKVAGVLSDAAAYATIFAAKGLRALAVALGGATGAAGSLSGGLLAGATWLERWGKLTLWASLGTVALGGAVAATGVAIGVAAAKAGNEFIPAWNRVLTLAKGSPEELRSLRNELESLAASLGVNQAEAAAQYYEVLSALPEAIDNPAAGLKVLEAALKASTGGFATSGDAIAAITGILYNYSLSADHAGEVADALFKAQDLGSLTMGEVAASISQAAPLVSSLGGSYQDLLAITALVTRGQTTTSEAMTQVSAAMSALLTQTGPAAQASKELGIQFDVAAVQAKGLAGFLLDIIDKTDGHPEVLAKFFGRKEAITLLVGLAQRTDELRQVVADTANSAGGADRIYKQMNETLDRQQALLAGPYKKALLDLGIALDTIAIKALEAMNAVQKFVLSPRMQLAIRNATAIVTGQPFNPFEQPPSEEPTLPKLGAVRVMGKPRVAPEATTLDASTEKIQNLQNSLRASAVAALAASGDFQAYDQSIAAADKSVNRLVISEMARLRSAGVAQSEVNKLASLYVDTYEKARDAARKHREELEETQKRIEALTLAASGYRAVIAVTGTEGPTRLSNGLAIDTDAAAQAGRDIAERGRVTSLLDLRPRTVTPREAPQVGFFDRVKAAGGQLSGGDLKGGLSTLGVGLGPLAVAAAALKPVFEGLTEALGPVLKLVAEPLRIIGQLLAVQLKPILQLLVPPLKLMAQATSYVVEALGWFVRSIGKLIDALPFVSGGPIIRAGQEMMDGARNARKALDDMGKSADVLASALSTDIPKAINLALYRQRFGGGGGVPSTAAPSPYAPADPYNQPHYTPGTHPQPTPAQATYYITIQGANKSGEQLLTEVETAAQKRIGKGGHVAIGVAA